jgi:hypothetical protein
MLTLNKMGVFFYCANYVPSYTLALHLTFFLLTRSNLSELFMRDLELIVNLKI